MRTRTSVLFSSFLLAATASAQLVDLAADVFSSIDDVAASEYDFIVVGGGTAGCVVANRLSEDPDVNVLLIEAGIVSAGLDEDIPLLSLFLTPDAGPWDWNYTTVPQPALNDRQIPYSRGKLLGGSSSVNFMVYNRGGSDDFDRIANFTEDERWSWDSLQPFMTRLEKFTPPADGRNYTGMFIPSAHGFDGPLDVSIPGYETVLDPLVLEATTQMDGYPYNEDMNQGNEIGIGWSYVSLGGTPPNRSSSATAYLEPIMKRSNLNVLVETQVTRLLQTGSNSGIPAFNGVEFSKGAGEQLYNITASKEVILSAGTVGTPQILLLSGIGPSADLQEVGIEPLVELADVGQQMQDHPLLPNQFFVNSTGTWETALRNETVMNSQIEEYLTTGQGPLANSFCNQIAWLRFPDNATMWENATDPSAGPTSGHYELVFVPGFVGPIQTRPDEGNFITVVSNLVQPISRGFIKLNTSSPWDAPIIDPALLKENLDLVMLREAHKSAVHFLTAPAFDGFMIGPYGTAGVTDDDEVDAYIRNFTTTVWHPVGSARMAPNSSDIGVVDSSLVVKNLTGVRVVDASVFPYIPAAHPEAAIYIVAEAASDMIKQTWGISGSLW